MNCAVGDYICQINNCSGGIGSGGELFAYWELNNCPASYSQLLNTTSTGTFGYNENSQELVQDEIVKLFNTYFITNTLTDDVTSTSYNTFQNTLLNLCINPTLPGVCNKFLTNYCKSYTRDDVINSPTLINFCGCYVEPDQTYLKYTLGSPECLIGSTGCTSGCTAGTSGCTGQPACDPLCHRALTSHKAYEPTGNIITCPQSICVVDDVIISSTQSKIPGGINFNSICSGCRDKKDSSGCLCVVSGINISKTMSNIGIGSNFDSFCGTNSVCIVEDNAGNIISEGECKDVTIANVPIPFKEYLPNLGILFIMIFFVMIIFLLAIIAKYSGPKVNYPKILEEKVN